MSDYPNPAEPPNTEPSQGASAPGAAGGSTEVTPPTPSSDAGYVVDHGVWTWSETGAAPNETPMFRDGAAHVEPATHGTDAARPGDQPFLAHQAGGSYQPTSYQPTSYQPTESFPTASYAPAGPYADSGAPLATSSVATAERPRRVRSMVIGTAVLAALIGGGAGAATVAVSDGGHSTTASSGLSTSNSTAPVAAVANGTVVAAAAKIKPSVVTIQVTGTSESGTGSGVIIRSDGYILTNDHVVSVAANGGSITVQLADGRSAKGTIVGRDTTDDLAVIKVSGLTDLTAATFANSSALVAGQTVVAVGAPLGLSDSVTAGIVSATARTVRSGDENQAVFAAVQTDAAINPGNSGGALVDLNGQVIGINSAIASTSSGQDSTSQSGNIGIGFAIPSNEASRVAGELISTGKASHALLGVSVASAQSPTSAGATIESVTPTGAAAAAGLKAGDVVTAVGSDRISDGDDLIAAIHAHAVKDTVTVTYTRDGQSHTVKATLLAGTN